MSIGKVMLISGNAWRRRKSWYPPYYGVPSRRKLIAAYRGEKISDKQLAMELHRIFFSIVQSAPLPIDMERMAFARVIRRAVCDSIEEWEHLLLEPACTIICKRLNRGGEEYTVALDKGNRKSPQGVSLGGFSCALMITSFANHSIVYFPSRMQAVCSTVSCKFIPNLRPHFSSFLPLQMPFPPPRSCGRCLRPCGQAKGRASRTARGRGRRPVRAWRGTRP